MSSLETSVTLHDVFTVVEAKRVPLAPELAGYLSLEIADGTDAGSGNVEPKTVFISEEGTVALVRPKRDAITGDAEASIRSLLQKLLDASGSGTPALTTAARRKPGNGLPALVEELEAALIPVNRAAGRRALARLAREVKRVLLGVGRNASVPAVVKESLTKSSGPHARPTLRKKATAPPPRDEAATRFAGGNANATKSGEVRVEDSPQIEIPLEPRVGPFGKEAATAKRSNALAELASHMNALESASSAEPAESSDGFSGAPAPNAPIPAEEPSVAGRPAAVAETSALEPPPLIPSAGRMPTPSGPALSPRGQPLPPPPSSKPSAVPPPLPPKRDSGSVSAPEVEPKVAPKDEPVPFSEVPTYFGRDDVDNLLESFGVSNRQGDKQLAQELKAIAGLSPTPPPPNARTLAELTKDVGKDLPKRLESGVDGDSIEALLALADASGPVPAANIKADPVAHPEAKASPVARGEPASGARSDTPHRGALGGASSLPPSPIFGPPAAINAAGDVPGAPATLRQSAAEGPAPRAEESSRNLDFAASARQASAFTAEPSAKPKPEASARTKRDSTGPQPAHPTTAKRSRPADRRPQAPRTGMAMLIFALLVLAGGTAAIWKFAPHVFTGKKRPVVTPSAPSQSAAPPAPKCKVALILTDVPANAEILLRMGQAPVDVDRMPVGTRLELIATAEGYAPRRAVIKSDDVWNTGRDGKPRIEVPIQLDPSKAKAGAVDPWPAAEPGSQVGGSGAPGTVHVVSNVRGAEVWLLAGLGPEARIDQLRCDADIDVLLAGPPSLRKRLQVGEKELAAAIADPQGSKIVNVSAK